MLSSLVPNSRLLVAYTIEILHILFSVLYLAPTALAKSFVHDYLPQRFIDLPSFKHVAVWFPNYPADGKEKGGMAFFKAPGHALMDYMTFAILRLVPSITAAKHVASSLASGEMPPCSYKLAQEADT